MQTIQHAFNHFIATFDFEIICIKCWVILQLQQLCSVIPCFQRRLLQFSWVLNRGLEPQKNCQQLYDEALHLGLLVVGLDMLPCLESFTHSLEGH